ncbi:MAG: 2-oxoacid:acceptor oxidoreductase family protein [Thermodesulfovibrionales bacterium]|nr:2-oxoacid:acceptor oxidoreductase family protein [Thermodesulfovibrionales bacterium]
MKEKGIIIAGFGGQGILFLGKTIAHAAMLSEKEVTWFPSYGAEMRGGTANCTVVISDELIGSPVVNEIDILIVFNEASLKKFFQRLKKDGLLFYDSSVINSDVIAGTANSGFPVPATEIAAREGNPRGANMVMLGAFIAVTGILKIEDIFKALEETIPLSRIKLVEINKTLIMRGIEYIENKKTINK